MRHQQARRVSAIPRELAMLPLSYTTVRALATGPLAARSAGRTITARRDHDPSGYGPGCLSGPGTGGARSRYRGLRRRRPTPISDVGGILDQGVVHKDTT